MSTRSWPKVRAVCHVFNSRAGSLSNEIHEEEKQALLTRRDGWCVVQMGVQTAVADQLGVGALFLDYASIDNNNAVNPVKRGEPVGDKDHCLVSKMLR